MAHYDLFVFKIIMLFLFKINTLRVTENCK